VKLTRRDALAALSGLGIVAGGAGAALSRNAVDGGEEDPAPSLDTTLATLTATAEVVYPSEVDGVESFVETYSLGRIEGRPEYREGVGDAVVTLDETARLWEGSWFRELPPEDRDSLLRQLGVHTAEEAPDGTVSERVRYYVVNELLYALYASPTGGELVGIENPQGHPGGIGSYQRGPR
jgi:hypothetical protein